MKPFSRYLTSNDFFRMISGGSISPPGRRSNRGQLVRQDTGGIGFAFAGNDEIEMEVPHNKALEVLQDV